MIYDVIVVGAGASGLFFSSVFGAGSDWKFRGLILEKGKRPGRKLLMSGTGQCNITHAGSIKDFIGCYGSSAGGESVSRNGDCRNFGRNGNSPDNNRRSNRRTPGCADIGRQIRSCLYKYNNLSLIDFLETGGVKTVIREDGKVFPASLNARDVLDLLLRKAAENGFEIRYECPVEQVTQMIISHEASRAAAGTACWRVTAAGETFLTHALIIATGGCSYPSTGSDGSMFRILTRDLGIDITPLKPALSSIQVEGYPYGALSGISFDPAQVTIRRAAYVSQMSEGGRKKPNGSTNVFREANGSATDTLTDNKNVQTHLINQRADALLFTHNDLSGPAILNLSKYADPGDIITINYVYPLQYEQALEKLKAAAHGAKGGLAGILSSEFHLPLRFCRSLIGRYGNSLKQLTKVLTGETFRVSSATGFDKSMATSGGIALSEMDMRTMECKAHPGLYAIGEALDVDGITGGYNLQFAYSSARMAAEAVLVALDDVVG